MDTNLLNRLFSEIISIKVADTQRDKGRSKLAAARADKVTIRYDTIVEFNVGSKAENISLI